MKIGQLSLLLLLVWHAGADVPSTDLPGAMRQGRKLIENRLALESTNTSDIVEQMMHAYDAQHPQDIQIEFLSMKQLQRLAQARTNDLVPRLLLLSRELTSDEDCAAWFAALKGGYAQCTNEGQRVTCLMLASLGVFQLEGKRFGKAMLGELKPWLNSLSSDRPTPAIAGKIQLMQLFAALGTEAYSEAPIYGRSTPFRTLAPLWMMSKGKWELALKEVQAVKQLPDLESDEKSMMDAFESILKGITEKKTDK